MSENATVADQAWEDINIDIGTIALDNNYAQRLNLPAAQPFPWDESKGIYLLAGFHDLHCLVSSPPGASPAHVKTQRSATEKTGFDAKQKTIRHWVVQIANGHPTTEPAEHMLHCLDALRQSVSCYADDTPRYTDHSHVSGVGQTRQCRSWGQLSDWAKQHSACWRFTGSHLNSTMSTKERYRYCPEGSPYLAQVEVELGPL